MSDEFNKELCSTNRKNIKEDIMELKEEMKSMSTKFWAIILLLVANLAGIAASLYKG